MIQQKELNFFPGPCYDPALDKDRLNKQLGKIYDLMRDQRYRTLSEIHESTGYSEASISAQLRHLRKTEYGMHTVNKRRRGEPGQGLWEYQVIPNTRKENMNYGTEPGQAEHAAVHH